MDMGLGETGNITTSFDVGEQTVEERFYPLCAMTPETTVVSDSKEAVVLPDSYLQRVVYKSQ